MEDDEQQNETSEAPAEEEAVDAFAAPSGHRDGPEFPTEGHREAYLRGLVLEKAGYDANKDKKANSAEVQAEIDRVTGTGSGSVERATSRPSRSRARKA